MKGTSKVIFANQLRGIAALLVVLSHLCCVFWRAKDTVSAYTGAPPAEGDQPWIGAYINGAYWNFGVLGVAIFFTISGFVIPMSLHHAGRLKFIAARALRIYPTYIIGLGSAMAVVWLSCQYWGRPFMWDLGTVLRNMLLIHTLTGTPSVDLVNWTLAIELKFYLVAALIAPLILAGRVWPLIAVSLLIFVANKIGHSAVGTEMLFVSFMFLGVLFNYLFYGLISRVRFALSFVVILGLFLGGWDASPWPDIFWIVAPGYLYGLLIFSMAYLARNHFRNFRLLDFLADISYPLYIVHSLVGYSVMRILFDHGLRLRFVAPITAVVVIGLALLIHLLVEKPSISLGKKLRKSPRTQVSSAAVAQARPVA
ncbi:MULTISPECIES: acyltransferase family protein [unclassified Pseudomonas]|uniref:acyltransferase family protein n=1 Tax=unclassified Pseudomonas TaxID=196821 RepID=UPI0025F9DF95|nr:MULTISPECIES: acyltransferase [unclassified Pseudomonas]